MERYWVYGQMGSQWNFGVQNSGMNSNWTHLETLERRLAAFAWESSASQILKGWRLEWTISVAPENWAALEQGRAGVREPEYHRSGMTIGSVRFARSNYRDKMAIVGTARKDLGKTWCCCFVERKILSFADVRIASNVFEADG